MSTAPPAAPPKVAPPVPPLHGPWPSYAPWARRWAVTGRPASRTTVVAILSAAVVAAYVVPLDRAGLGWLIAGAAGVIAMVVARAVPERPAPGVPPPLVKRSAGRGRLDRFGWGAATLALLAVGTFRSAGWLFLLCLLVAVLTGTLALTGGRSMRGIAAGATMPFVAAARSVPWLSRGAARLRPRRETGPNIRIVATLAVSVGLLVVFGGLFASADAAFADALARLVPDLTAGTLFRMIFLLPVAAMVLGGAAFLRASPPDLSGLDATEGRKVNRLEWAIPLGLLVLLFAAFVSVQLTVLFGGARHVLDTAGLTYANYARGGFWQLCFATGLTLLVLAGAARWAPRATPADRVLIRVILGALATLTLVIVGSALHRMGTYADTYGLTRLRLLVACCEAWFGLVLVFVLLAGVRIRAPWLPRLAIAAGVAALLGLAVANPDARIASYNIRQDRTVDLMYLTELSPDAVPALTGLDRTRRDCVLGHIGLAMDDDGWRGWNLGRERARKLIDTTSDFYCS